MVFSSLSTCDPGDIFATAAEASRQQVQVSVICLVAEIYICRQLAELTGGSFAVAADSSHLSLLLQEHTVPPPQIRPQTDGHTHPTAAAEEEESSSGGPQMVTDFVYMGFPKRVFDASSNSAFCFDGKRICLSSTSYICPRYRDPLPYSAAQGIMCLILFNQMPCSSHGYPHPGTLMRPVLHCVL